MTARAYNRPVAFFVDPDLVKNRYSQQINSMNMVNFTISIFLSQFVNIMNTYLDALVDKGVCLVETFKKCILVLMNTLLVAGEDLIPM